LDAPLVNSTYSNIAHKSKLLFCSVHLPISNQGHKSLH